MRLLVDQNLSPRLVAALATLYPDSTHVRDVGLATADDDVVWRYAADQGFTIVSKDAHAALVQFEGDPETSFLALG